MRVIWAKILVVHLRRAVAYPTVSRRWSYLSNHYQWSTSKILATTTYGVVLLLLLSKHWWLHDCTISDSWYVSLCCEQAGFSREQAGFSREQAGFSREQAGFSREQAGFSRELTGFWIKERKVNSIKLVLLVVYHAISSFSTDSETSALIVGISETLSNGWVRA